MTVNAFVVDDEAMARGNLLSALERFPHWRIQATFASGDGLVAGVADGRPDVVFLDIQMPGETGLDLARQLLALKSPPLIVFVTAYSEFAVSAFEIYAIDYLLKPFDDERMAICVNRVESLIADGTAHGEVIRLQSEMVDSKPIRRVLIKSVNSVRVVDVESIHWLAANGNYVDIHHVGGKHLLRASMKQLFASLPESEFVQVHRGFVVRESLIEQLQTIDPDRSVIHLTTGDEIPVGKSFRRRLLDRLSDLIGG
ncbi:MAG: LytTR family DNA-binding domain-containing protein [Pseudomonadota bacterium]